MIKEKLHGKLYGTDSKLIEEFRYIGEIREMAERRKPEEGLEKEVKGFPDREKA